jgi:hypothetical protein
VVCMDINGKLIKKTLRLIPIRSIRVRGDWSIGQHGCERSIDETWLKDSGR